MFLLHALIRTSHCHIYLTLRPYNYTVSENMACWSFRQPMAPTYILQLSHSLPFTPPVPLSFSFARVRTSCPLNAPKQVWNSRPLTFLQIIKISSGCSGMRLGILQKNVKLITPSFPGVGLVALGLVNIVSAMKRLPSHSSSKEPGKWPPARIAVMPEIWSARIGVYVSVKTRRLAPAVSLRSSHSSSGAPTKTGQENVLDQSAQVE